MANTKLDRIERDIEKTRAKILEQQKKLKDLEAQKVEEEFVGFNDFNFILF